MAELNQPNEVVGFPNPADWASAQQRQTQMYAIHSLEDNPDDAARAQELSEATGANPALVHGNLEQFEQQHRAAVTAQLLKDNQFLQEYAQSHPLAAKVSNDDWGALDEFTDALHRHQQLGALTDEATKAPEKLGHYLLASWLGAAKGMGESLLEDIPSPSAEELKTGPTLSGDLARIAKLPKAFVDVAFAIPSVAFAPALNPAIEGTAEATAQATHWTERFLDKILPGSTPPEDVEKVRAEIEPKLANAMFSLMSKGGELAPKLAPEHVQALEQVDKALETAKPWIQSNQKPPAGVDPLVDQGYAQLAESDAKSFDAAFKLAQKSTTRVRSPELMRQAAQAVTYGKMGISADAIRELYGDKVPEPDDNLLGWIPDLREQLDAAEKYGGDVEVSKALYLAKADPEVHKALAEHLRLRPGGLTLAETQAVEEPKPGAAGEPVQLERQVPDADKIGPFDEIKAKAREDAEARREEAGEEAGRKAGELTDKLFGKEPTDEEALDQIKEALSRAAKGEKQVGDRPGAAQYEALAQTLALKHGYIVSLGEWDQFVQGLKEGGGPQAVAAEERPAEVLAFPTTLEGKRRLAQREYEHVRGQVAERAGPNFKLEDIPKDLLPTYKDRLDRLMRAHEEWQKSQGKTLGKPPEENEPQKRLDRANVIYDAAEQAHQAILDKIGTKVSSIDDVPLELKAAYKRTLDNFMIALKELQAAEEDRPNLGKTLDDTKYDKAVFDQDMKAWEKQERRKFIKLVQDEPLAAEPREYVKGPAVRTLRGQVYEGRTHSEAYARLAADQGGELNKEGVTRGFVTSTGRFVEGQEAGRLTTRYIQTSDRAAQELDSATTSVRRLAGLDEPLFAKEIGERPGRVHLEKQNEYETYGDKTHEYLITDENGKWIGNLDVTEEDGGKRLYVDNISAGEGRTKAIGEGSLRGLANSIGPMALRDLFRQVAEEFPKAVERDEQGNIVKVNVSGDRVSGARAKAVAEGREVKSFVSKQVKPAEEITLRDLEDLFQPEDRSGWALPKTAERGGVARASRTSVPALYSFKLRDVIPKLDTQFMNKGERSLHAFFGGKFSQLVGDTPVRVVDAAGMQRLFPERPSVPAFYSQGEIVVRDGLVKAQYGPTVATEVMLHEAAHAFTYEALNRFPEIRKQARRLMQYVSDRLEAEDPAFRKAFSYAFSEPNAFEFVAEVPSRLEFRNRLVEMPVPKDLAKELGLNERTGTAWDAFKTLLKNLWTKLFGEVPDQSVMDAFLKLGENIEKANAKLKGMRERDEIPWEGEPRGAEERPPAETELRGRQIRLLPNPELSDKGGGQILDVIKGGERFGDMRIEPRDGGNTIHIWWLGAGDGGEEVGSLGAGTVRAIAREIKELYPEAKQLTFKRPSEGGGQTISGPLKEVSIPLDDKLLSERPRAEQELVGRPERNFERGSAVGMTEAQFKRYQRLLAQRDAEDQAAVAKRLEAEARMRLTPEWKANEAKVREEAEDQVRARGDIQADNFIRKWREEGEKSDLDPDALAQAFGFDSGEQMNEALTRLHNLRAGQDPEKFIQGLIDYVTDSRMKERYGDLDTVIEAAKDRALSETQLNLLHEDLKALGQKINLEEGRGITLADMKRYAKEQFDRTQVGSHSSDKYLRLAGKADKALQEAMAKGDWETAYQEKQRQFLSTLLAKEARTLEKERAQDAKLRKRLARPEPGGIDPEYTIWAQDILGRTGTMVRRSLQGIERQKALVATDKSLRDFVESVNKKQGIYEGDPDAMPVGQQMPVAEFLLDPAYRKQPAEMTVEEWRAVANSLKTIAKNGRDVNRYNVKGYREELKDTISGLVERLKAAVGGKVLDTSAEQRTSVLRTIGSLMLNPESWFKRLDLGNSQGPFAQLILRPITEGQYTLRTLEREASREYRAIGEIKDPGKKITNNLFREPRDNFQSLISLDRENLSIILQNMGNELQRRKLAAGYGIKDPNQIWQFLANNGIGKEDVVRAQRMGKFFSDLFAKSEKMYAGLTGFTPDRIQLGKVQTPWGEVDEWYHPLIPDPTRHGGLRPEQMMDESGYFKPTTNAGYTKARTGVVYPLDLTSNGIATKVKMMLNDIAMRPSVTEVSKILLDKDFRNAFTHYYGKEYEKALIPWLRDVAGQRRYTPSTDSALNSVANYIRENMASLMIGLNLGTVLKHGPTAWAFSMKEVGAKNFLDSFTHMIAHDTATGQSRWRFSMENSEELQNRLRTVKENITASNAELFRQKNWNHKFFTMRDLVQTIGSAPVAGSDLISAVPMWDAAYRNAIEAGDPHGTAVYKADTAVRTTHGSTITSNRPAIMRTQNPWVQAFMPFYNFFNNAFQRAYEYSWKAKLATQGRELPEMTGFEKEQFEAGAKNMTQALGGLLVFGVMTSLIEQAVDPLHKDPKENPIWYGSKVIARGPINMIPGVRDLVNALWEHRDPSGGLIGSFYRDVTQPLIDRQGKFVDTGKLIRRINMMIGAAFGLTNDEIGKVGQYMYNVGQGKEHPKGLPDIYRGVRHGTQKEYRR